MDDLLGEVGKGLIRFVIYILGEIFFSTVCYWVGWPICRLLTWGRYPQTKHPIYFDTLTGNNEGFLCCMVGFLALLGVLVLVCWLV